MIPERTHEALKNGGIGHIGSANAELKTTHTETFGASLDNENNTVTCFVLSLLAEPILKNLTYFWCLFLSILPRLYPKSLFMHIVSLGECVERMGLFCP